MTGADRRPLWFRGALAGGAFLALLVLAQTVAGYNYVSGNLIRQEALRSAERAARTLRTAIRVGRVRDATTLSPLLEEIRSDTQGRMAWLLVTDVQGRVLASSKSEIDGIDASDDTGSPAANLVTRLFSADERRATLNGEVTPVSMPGEHGLPVIAAMVPCRCLAVAPAPADGSGNLASRRVLVQVGLHEEFVAASFSRLRRTSLINGGAALALLGALALISRRFPAFVRGRQLESHLELARQVQHDLQASSGRAVPGVEFAAECLPTAHVGGDFYDVRATGANRAAFLLGDVSGHGLSAALVMALVHGALAGIDWTGSTVTRERAMRRLNRLLVDKTAPERFVTMFWCDYDAEAGELRYLNAGHVPPLLVRGGGAGPPRVERLEGGGPPLGILPTARFEETCLPVSPGDLLVVVSDGITEADQGAREQFGDTRLAALVLESAHLPAGSIRDAIVAGARVSTADIERDDQTVLVARLGAPVAERTKRDLELTA